MRLAQALELPLFAAPATWNAARRPLLPPTNAPAIRRTCFSRQRWPSGSRGWRPRPAWSHDAVEGTAEIVSLQVGSILEREGATRPGTGLCPAWRCTRPDFPLGQMLMGDILIAMDPAAGEALAVFEAIGRLRRRSPGRPACQEATPWPTSTATKRRRPARGLGGTAAERRSEALSPPGRLASGRRACSTAFGGAYLPGLRAGSGRAGGTGPSSTAAAFRAGAGGSLAPGGATTDPRHRAGDRITRIS